MQVIEFLIYYGVFSLRTEDGDLYIYQVNYNPKMIVLKLYIYGYLNRVQSSRRLELESGRNVEVMWLTSPR